ncbi:MAG: hypothetical protein LBF38_05150 [Deltaproteobacteria bacterium]|jgi:uncharacterized protein YPO0396|nr:hypothetical protein [Deltaproteobacteria bacterium]
MSGTPLKNLPRFPMPSLLDDIAVTLKADQQFRLVRFQLHNWGTFSDYHDIPVSEEGFLVTGFSGSGKTTLLDAYSTILIPGRFLEYNSAARDSGRADRNLMSYVRGAWGAIRTEGESQTTTQYLRPGPTWSSLALTFKKGSADYLTLIQLFWVKGTSLEKISRHYFAVNRPLSLEELNFAEKNFDLRELKAGLSFDLESKTFDDYHHYFARILGLNEYNALKLLQKTQSMKNIEDLDSFLRNFMLDDPDTYAYAHTLVDEFTSLNEAHEAVLKAKNQIEVLGHVKVCLAELEKAETELNDTKEQIQALSTYADLRKKELIESEMEELAAKEKNLERDRIERLQIQKNKQSQMSDLRLQYSGNEGDMLDHFVETRKDLINRVKSIRQNLDRVKKAQTRLELGDFGGQADFEDLKNEVAAKQKAVKERRDNLGQEYKSLVGQEYQAREEIAATRKKMAALKDQNGNVPAEDWELRKSLLNDLDLDEPPPKADGSREDFFPFLGQLVSVKPEESQWEGALERALSRLATSILVPEQHYEKVVKYANEGPVGGRLSFLKVPKVPMNFPVPATKAAASLLGKLDIKPGPYERVVVVEILRRLNLLCVDSLEAFRANVAALTPEGLVKFDGELHEKDDLLPLNDVRGFRLGFDGERKLAAFAQIEEKQLAELAALETKVNGNASLGKELDGLAKACELILGFSWEEIDAASLNDRIRNLDERIEQIHKKSESILNIKNKMDSLQQELYDLTNHLSKINAELSYSRIRTNDLSAELNAILFNEFSPFLNEENSDKLFRHFSGHGILTLKNINEIKAKVGWSLDNLKNEWERRYAQAESKLITSFNEFIYRWPGDSLDLEPKLTYAQDYVKIYENLEKDGLPKVQSRFKELLREHSQQNAAALSISLRNELQSIKKRMDIVNEGLAGVPFNKVAGQATFLNLRLTVRHVEDLDQFKDDLKKVSSNLHDEDPAQDEERFKILKRLVTDLSSSDKDKVNWRERVLDVRRHVEFYGRELDESGTEIETYRSGAGKSGGQRQKLAATCLAAALRYQLGGKTYGYPRFGTVVFDEAFDKIDHELTIIALEIFKKLGFQMILATPMKNITAVEPYIGGAVFVSITDRKHSNLTSIIYDPERKKLQWPNNRPPEAH